MRMPPCRIPKQALFYRPDGTMDLGRLEDYGMINTLLTITIVNLGMSHRPKSLFGRRNANIQTFQPQETS